MSTLATVLIVLEMIASVIIIAVVLLQSGKSAGLSGALSGSSDTFLAKNKSKTWDAKLAKMTKWVAIAYVLLVISINFAL